MSLKFTVSVGSVLSTPVAQDGVCVLGFLSWCCRLGPTGRTGWTVTLDYCKPAGLQSHCTCCVHPGLTWPQVSASTCRSGSVTRIRTRLFANNQEARLGERKAGLFQVPELGRRVGPLSPKAISLFLAQPTGFIDRKKQNKGQGG